MTENFMVTRKQNKSVEAVLVETGFITNLIQEELMNTDAYLSKVANAIGNGITNTIINVE